MLTLVIALFYGYWFYKTAQERIGRNPWAWAAIGYLTFAVSASILTRGASQLYVWMMIRDNHFSQDMAYAVSAVFALSGWIAAQGFALLVRNLFLYQGATGAPWSLKQAKLDTAERRSIAMPGRFPLYFMMYYAAFMLTGLMLAMVCSLLLLERPGGTIMQGKPLLDTAGVIVKASGYALVLWRGRHWAAIALGWTLVTASVSAAGVYYQLWDVSYTPPLQFFAPMIASAALAILTVLFCVHHWGASLKVLLLSWVVPRLLVDLPFMLLTAKGPVTGDMVVMPFLWAILMALSLYTGLLMHRKQEEAVEAPPAGKVAFSS